MNQIKIGDIDFPHLQIVHSDNNLESTIYHDDKKAYKIFKGQNKNELKFKKTKIEILGDGIQLPNVVMPQDVILSEDYFWGYSMDYIQNSIPLYDFMTSNHEYFEIIRRLSQTIAKIHQDPRNIVIGDLNFDNIVMDKDNNFHIVDIDSCQIAGIPNETISQILMLYLTRTGISPKNINQNHDRLSLLLSVLTKLFNKHILTVSMYEYDKKAERIHELKDIKKVLLEVKKSKTTPTVPYIHDIIPRKTIRVKKRI